MHSIAESPTLAPRRTYDPNRPIGGRAQGVDARPQGEQVTCMPRYVWYGYVAWAGLLSAVYFFLPAVGILPFAGVVLASMAAIVWGIRRNRPRRRLPWILLAVS